MELKIEHLSKQFKDKTAVNDVNLTLTPGIWDFWERITMTEKTFESQVKSTEASLAFCRRILGITGILRSKIIWSIQLR